MNNEQDRYRSPEENKQSKTVHRLIVGGAQVVMFALTVATSLLAFSEYGVSVQAIAISAFFAFLALSVSINVIQFFALRRSRRRSYNIAFITPSGGDQPFYSAMLECLVRNCSLATAHNFVVIPAMPATSFETITIWSLFSSLEDKKIEIDAVVFIPDHPDDHFEEITSFSETQKKLPVILADVYFDVDRYDDRSRSRMPPFVGGDEIRGGQIAAEIVSDLVDADASGDSVRIVVVRGADTAWERQRTDAFTKKLGDMETDFEIITTEPINYDRAVASQTFYELAKRSSEKQVIEIDAVFACNDDMAIGVRSAILRLKSEGFEMKKPCKVVGYDGVREMLEYIRGEDDYIYGTVDVQINEQAKKIISVLQSQIRGNKLSERVNLITPKKIIH